MRKITINLAEREKGEGLAPALGAVILLFAAFLTWHNIERYSSNRSQIELLKERTAAFEKNLPDGFKKDGLASVEDRKILLDNIEFVNGYAYRKSFSWTSLLTSLEEALPDDVHLVRISPEFNSGKVNVTGFTRSIDSALSTVDRMGKAGFLEVFLLKHSMDGKSGLILFDLSAIYKPASL